MEWKLQLGRPDWHPRSALCPPDAPALALPEALPEALTEAALAAHDRATAAPSALLATLSEGGFEAAPRGGLGAYPDSSQGTDELLAAKVGPMAPQIAHTSLAVHPAPTPHVRLPLAAHGGAGSPRPVAMQTAQPAHSSDPAAEAHQQWLFSFAVSTAAVPAGYLGSVQHPGMQLAHGVEGQGVQRAADSTG